MARRDETIGQISLLPAIVDTPAVASAPEFPEDFDPEKPLQASRLIAVLAARADLPHDFTTEQDLARVTPETIIRGLIIDPRDARELEAEHKVENVLSGVGFDPIHFDMVARSPRDLAKSKVIRSRKANKLKPAAARLPIDEAEETASRAGGHALEGLYAKEEELRTILRDQRAHLK